MQAPHKSKRKPSGDRVEAIGTALKNKVARQRIRTVLYRNKLLLKNPLPLGMGSVKCEHTKRCREGYERMNSIKGKIKPCLCGSVPSFAYEQVGYYNDSVYFSIHCEKCGIKMEGVQHSPYLAMEEKMKFAEEIVEKWNAWIVNVPPPIEAGARNMAQIENAYIVHIDFDGDIKSKYSCGKWLVFTELEEVKSVIAEALNDLMHHQKEKGRDETILIGERYVPIADVLKSEPLLEEYIDQGGSDMGNWEISIYKTF